MRKKWIRLIAAAVGSFLLAGCGADTQIDDYATNAGSGELAADSGDGVGSNNDRDGGNPEGRDQGGSAPSVRPGRRKRIHVHA